MSVDSFSFFLLQRLSVCSVDDLAIELRVLPPPPSSIFVYMQFLEAFCSPLEE